MYYRDHARSVWTLSLIEFITLSMILAGILILSLGRTEKCNSRCIEKTCLSIYYDSYPCDCGATCQQKSVVTDGVYRLGVALLIIGIIGSIFSSVYLCINRSRYYRHLAVMQAPMGQTVIMQGGGIGVFPGGGISVVQGGIMPIQYGQTPNVYAQGMPVGMPNNNYGGVNYGYPVQGQMSQNPTQIQYN